MHFTWTSSVKKLSLMTFYDSRFVCKQKVEKTSEDIREGRGGLRGEVGYRDAHASKIHTNAFNSTSTHSTQAQRRLMKPQTFIDRVFYC